MIKPLNDFVNKFHTNVTLDENLILKKESKYFLVTKALKRTVSSDFFYAGLYLGKVENGRFWPSFNLLNLIARKRANKVTVDKKTEWLFTCGRDIFRQGIVKATGSTNRGNHVLVMNQHNECLGFGKILHDLNDKRKGVTIKNILDVGDFLRREKTGSLRR
jgi:ribosome biogenesis protein Nip4